MTMDGKAAITSKTYWGIALALISPYIVPIIDSIGAQVPAQWQPVVQGLSAIAGGVLAIYGRKTATQPITGLFKAR